MLVEEEEPEAEAPRVESATGVTPAPAPAPEWDESAIEPEGPTYLPSRTWERGFDANERSQAASVSPDSVLNQLDEIEASLRKKKSAPSSGVPADVSRK